MEAGPSDVSIGRPRRSRAAFGQAMRTAIAAAHSTADAIDRPVPYLTSGMVDAMSYASTARIFDSSCR
jgi:hypothetical protein